MRVAIVDSDYRSFLDHLYATTERLHRASYAEQMSVRRAAGFGIVESYAASFERLGWDAFPLYVNNEHAQRAWAQEHLSRRAPWRQIDLRTILRRQVRSLQPDLLVCLDVSGAFGGVIDDARQHVKVLVGQHAATTIPRNVPLAQYDLLVSSFPPTVEHWRQQGLRAEYLALAADPDLVARAEGGETLYDVSFVGNFFPGIHDSRRTLVEALCDQLDDVSVWTPSVESLPTTSTIRRCIRGNAWGLEMLSILKRSRIVINHHGDIAPYANNIRMFEATACGSLLLTDAKMNLGTLFEPEAEVATYDDIEQCVARAAWYLEHDEERERIAQSGHARTLNCHTYDVRMADLLDLVSSQIGAHTA